MNKANVFLLVVVSSLLTYISMATQPAATAGVAQEKWEYGFSRYFEITGFDLAENKSITTTQFDFISNTGSQNFTLTNEDGKILLRKGTDAPVNLSKDSVAPPMFLFPDKSTELIDALGESGWHPYQVVPNDDYPFNWVRSSVYWRRRVQ